MIGRQIDGEQVEHLARFMAANKPRCAFEEADRTARPDALLRTIGVLLFISALCLAQFIDDFGRVL